MILSRGFRGGDWGELVSVDELRRVLRLDDSRIWLLIGLCVALVFTIQSVETATEGAWPHQRRPSRIAPQARSAQGAWSVVAFLLLPGIVLGILNVAVLLWRGFPHTQAQVLGGLLVGLIWIIFVGASVNFLGMGRMLRQGGIAGPLALLVLLIAGDILLLTGLLNVLPDRQVIQNAIVDLIP
ncbi:MAG: hypothetical protein U0031_21665 [Thermomicrobiales bacterium]